MKIAFFTRDLGPSRVAMFYAREALRREHSINLLGYDCTSDGMIDLFNIDVLVTSISSFDMEKELLMGKEAGKRGIPWIAISDVYYTWSRPGAESRVSNAIYCVASESEVELARNFGYKDVKFFGNPPSWQEFANTPQVEIERAGDEKIILVNGTKNPAITDKMAELVIRAMRDITPNWRLIFIPHGKEFVAEVDENRRQKSLEGADIIQTSAMPENLLETVDIAIHTGGPSETIIGPYLRAPSIYYMDDMVREHLRKQIKTDIWPPAESGACAIATPETLASVISELLTEEGRAKQRKIQEEVYPLDQRFGERTEDKVLDFIESLV